MYKLDDNVIEISKKRYEETLVKQSKKGLETYGKPIDPLEESRDWLTMMEEEVIDSHQYLVAEIVKRRFIVGKIRRLLNYKNNSVSKVEINYWLDVLEGKTNIKLEK